MTKKSNDKNPNTGNKTFSLNTKSLESSIIFSNIQFIFYYFIITIIYFYFSSSLNIQTVQVGKTKYFSVENKFRDICHPLFENFNILTTEYFNNKTLIGLSFQSYVFLLTIFIIGFLFLLKSLISTNVFKIILSAVQINKNVNPYNNPNTISKLDKSPFVESSKSYSYLFVLSLFMLLPLLIHYIIQKMNWTQRDVQKSFYIKLSIFLALFFGVIHIIIHNFTTPKLMNPLNDAEKYFINKDKNYVQNINNKIKYSFFTFLAPLLFILIFFSLINIIYKEVDKNSTLVILSYLILFIIIPLILVAYSLNIVYNDYNNNTNCSSYSSNIELAVKNGVKNFYQAIVKYNYPCFFR